MVTTMMIRLKVDNKTKYYQHTSSGKPILAGKGMAAQLDSATAEKVLEHLKLIDHRFKDAELVS